MMDLDILKFYFVVVGEKSFSGAK